MPQKKLKDPKGGLTAAGRAHFKETEGANLKPGVKGPADTPEKKRRKGSFLTRFFTNPSGPLKDDNGNPTRLALSAAAWGEPVPTNAAAAARLAAKGRRLLEQYKSGKEEKMFITKESGKGLWHNIREKRRRGEKPSHPNSEAFRSAVEAGKKIREEEAKEEGGDSKPKSSKSFSSNAQNNLKTGELIMKAAGRRQGKFDESKHKRGNDGRFSSTGGGGKKAGGSRGAWRPRPSDPWMGDTPEKTAEYLSGMSDSELRKRHNDSQIKRLKQHAAKARGSQGTGKASTNASAKSGKPAAQKGSGVSKVALSSLKVGSTIKDAAWKDKKIKDIRPAQKPGYMIIEFEDGTRGGGHKDNTYDLVSRR